MLKLLKAIPSHSRWVLNNRGIAPWIIPTAIGAGSKLLSRFMDRKKDDEEEKPQFFVDPWMQKLRDIYQPRFDPSFFNIPPTGVEAATSQKLLGRLGRTREQLVPRFGAEAAKPYYEAEKARRQEGFGEEQTFLKDILQREGVLTSTPGIQAQTKLKRQQGLEMGAFGERLMYEDIARDIQASQIAEDIIANTIGQATMLGGMQRQALQWPFIMSQQALGGAQGLSGAGVMPEGEGEGLLSQLGGGAMDVGKMMLLSQLLKGGSNIWTGRKT